VVIGLCILPGLPEAGGGGGGGNAPLGFPITKGLLGLALTAGLAGGCIATLGLEASAGLLFWFCLSCCCCFRFFRKSLGLVSAGSYTMSLFLSSDSGLDLMLSTLDLAPIFSLSGSRGREGLAAAGGLNGWLAGFLTGGESSLLFDGGGAGLLTGRHMGFFTSFGGDVLLS